MSRDRYKTVPEVRTRAPSSAMFLGVDLIDRDGFFKTVAEIEREAILKVISVIGKEDAASTLGIGRTTLYRKLKRWER